jgi:hypothetical protein
MKTDAQQYYRQLNAAEAKQAQQKKERHTLQLIQQAKADLQAKIARDKDGQ